MKLTKIAVDNLKPKAERYEIWDGEGFGVRVFPSGIKSWVAVFRFNGIRKRITYGHVSKIGLADAYVLHAAAMKKLEQGVDPCTEKKLQKIADKDALTISQLINEYLEKWAKPRKRSWQEDKRILEKEVLPNWSNIKAKQIKRRDVVLLLDAIAERAPIMSNRTLAVIRRMFNFAVERDILEHSPCTQIKMPAPEKRRERILSEDEIKKVWPILDKKNMFISTALALKVELITAQRKGEVATMRWDEVDLKAKTWTIPAEKSKNKNKHTVPLSKLALQLLKESKKTFNHPVWVFPALFLDSHITETAINNAVYRMRKDFKKMEVAHFTPHDLRRTAASHMTALGIPRLVVSKILNHVENSVTAIYDRHTYDNEKREALEAWSKKLERIIKRKP